eukprot:gene6419-7695_t
MANYWLWEKAYVDFLEGIRTDREMKDCTLLYMVEEKERLLRFHQLDDPFRALKSDENQVAEAIYPLICKEFDTEAIECALSGNLFDAGNAAAVADIAFCDEDQCDVPANPFALKAAEVERTHRTIRERVARPADSGWRYDDFE